MQSEAPNISIDDYILVEKCRKGDPAGLERLILKYQDRLYNVILKICANPDDAAELTQETFVKVIENIDKFEGRSSIYTWIFRIGVNLTITHCRRSLKLGLKSLDSELDQPDSRARTVLKDLMVDSKSIDPSVVSQKKELYEIIMKALMKLDDSHRTVVVLKDIEGMSYAGIAEVLNIELGTVKSRLSRARANLREILEAIVQ